MKFPLHLIAAAIAVNLFVPKIAARFATPEEISPSDGAAVLPFKSQLMHMFVHHSQVPVSSSVVIAIVVLISVWLAKYLRKLF